MAINLIKEKLEKQLELLKELEQSIEAEKYRYVVKYEHHFGNSTEIYSLYDRDVDDIIKVDRLSRILSWLNVRNIPIEQVKIIHENGNN
jgi:hypothetical protein